MSQVIPYTRSESLGPERDRSYPRFHIETVRDPVASEREGREIWRDEERVEIFLPGNPTTRPVQRVTEDHKRRWPKEYEAFKAGLEMSVDGTPLEQWNILSKSQVMELKALGLMTVEHVADMGQQTTQRIPIGGQRLKTLASAYLDDAVAQAELSKKTAENEKLQGQVTELQAKVTELGSLLDRVHSELQGLRNAPNPIASTAPMMLDPVERARIDQARSFQPSEAMPQSSLDSLPDLPRRRGRPPKVVGE